MTDLSSILNPEMMPQLLQQLGQTGGFGQHGQYQGRFNANPITGAGMFSFAHALRPFGEAGESAGGMVDTLGMLNMLGPGFQQFRSTLQGFRGADPMVVAREQTMMQSRAQLQMGISGTNVSRMFGLDPESGMGKFVGGSAGMLSMMMPEFRSAIDVITPGALTNSSDLMSAVQMQDTMQRINPLKTESMRQAFLARTMSDDKDNLTRTRRNDRTAGMNLDDFSQVVRFAQDTGATDKSLAEGSPEFDKRVQDIVRKKIEHLGKAFEKSSLKGIEEEARGQVGQEALVRGGEFQAGIARSMNRTFGLTTGESLQMMRDNGIVASDKDSSARITESINRIEALGRAAGMTSQDLINAGRVVQQQQYGGSFLSGAQMVAEVQANERLSSSPGFTGAAAGKSQEIIDTYQRVKGGTGYNIFSAAMKSNNASISAMARKLADGGGSDADYGALETAVRGDAGTSRILADLATDPTFRRDAEAELDTQFGHEAMARGLKGATMHAMLQSLSGPARRIALQAKGMPIEDLARLRHTNSKGLAAGNDAALVELRKRGGISISDAESIGAQKSMFDAVIDSYMTEKSGDPLATQFQKTRAEGDRLADLAKNNQQSIVDLILHGKYSVEGVGKALGISGDAATRQLMNRYSSGGRIGQAEINMISGLGAVDPKDRDKYLGDWNSFEAARTKYEEGVAKNKAGALSADDLDKLKADMNGKAAIGARLGVNWLQEGSWDLDKKEFMLGNGARQVDGTEDKGKEPPKVVINNNVTIDGNALAATISSFVKQSVETIVNGKTSTDHASGQSRKGGSGANSSRMT